MFSADLLVVVFPRSYLICVDCRVGEPGSLVSTHVPDALGIMPKGSFRNMHICLAYPEHMSMKVRSESR